MSNSSMNILNFVASVILITVSGALAPGPLFFATISHGAKSGVKGGLIFSMAHTLVEFTLVIVLALGIITVASEPAVRIVVGVVGGVALMSFGSFQIRSSLKSKSSETAYRETKTRDLFLIGLAFTGLNPYFILWWLTAGANLIILSLDEFTPPLAGVLFMYICHVWMDYAWLSLLAHFAKRGTSIIGLRWYRLILVVFGAVLIYFGFTFLRDSLSF